MSDPHPEARLLELIRGPKGVAPRGQRRAAAWFRRGWERLREVVSGLDTLRGAEIFLALLVLASATYFFLVAGSRAGEEEPTWGAAPPSPPRVREAAGRPLAEYMRVVEGRRLFEPPTAPEEKPARPGIRQLAAGLQLMGFMESGGENQAVLLDTRTGLTHYLKPGDTVRGLSVESVTGGRVVLTFEGERLALQL